MGPLSVPELSRARGNSLVRWDKAWRHALREHEFFLAIIAAEFASAAIAPLWGVQILRPRSWDLSSMLGTLSDTSAWFLVLVAWHRIRVCDGNGHAVAGLRGWQSAGQALVRERLRTDRILGALIASLGVMFEAFVHDNWKSNIGVLQPYQWDPAFHRLDLVLHGGVSPWEWLQPWLGRPLITKALDQLYASWYIVLAGVLVWQCWTTRRLLRAQFFICYMLTFVLLGTVAAHLLASAGPCFYGPLLGSEDPYAPLMKYLGDVNAHYPLTALEIQSIVWRNHLAGIQLRWVGMSAMPSLHVGLAVLFALVGWAQHRLLGVALTGFALITLIGSVHLGWHYAVDGYVAAIVVVALWQLSGWLVRQQAKAGRV